MSRLTDAARAVLESRGAYTLSSYRGETLVGTKDLDVLSDALEDVETTPTQGPRLQVADPDDSDEMPLYWIDDGGDIHKVGYVFADAVEDVERLLGLAPALSNVAAMREACARLCRERAEVHRRESDAGVLTGLQMMHMAEMVAANKCAHAIEALPDTPRGEEEATP